MFFELFKIMVDEVAVITPITLLWICPYMQCFFAHCLKYIFIYEFA